MHDATIHTSSEEETSAVGERLGRELGPGDLVLLTGQLGAGKTAFVRGLARGIGASPREVSSPTFTLIQDYAGSGVTLHHVDLYRLEPAEIGDLGLDELVSGNDIAAVEWADRWNDWPAAATRVWLEDAGGERRTIRIVRGGGPT